MCPTVLFVFQPMEEEWTLSILRQANLATGTYPPMAEDFTLKATNSSYFHES